MNWPLRVFAGFLLLVTLAPFFRSGKWYIRWWDFPRSQVLMLLTLAFALLWFWQPILGAQKVETEIWAAALLIAIAWQTSHILPFSRLWPKEVPDTSPDADAIKILVANLDYENTIAESRVIQELAEEQAEILLLIEFDERWSTGLSELKQTFEFHHEVIRGEGLGIALWSNLPVENCEERFLVSDRRASIWANLQFPDGTLVNFVGVHPTPPGLLDSTGDERRDSRVRDAELILIAKEVASRADEAWLIAGDFNDVAWSHTTRLFKRKSGLLDPRIGRSFMGTYIAKYPLLRCPIDHIFVSRGFSIGHLSRKPISGSDHFAVLASVHLHCPKIGVEPNPQGDDMIDAAVLIEEGIEDAKERDILSDESPP